jgi:diphosphomevalonate decarboxylase
VNKSFEKVWRASAPSNIALIKYMGKTEISSSRTKNQPMNSSLSFTLNHLQSYVEIKEVNGAEDSWEPLDRNQLKYFEDSLSPSFTVPELSKNSQTRFLKHLQFLKNHFGVDTNFRVRSANGFPADCGLASSASSFAALTICAADSLSELSGQKKLSRTELAELSRQGSGSSCRSLFSPWGLWTPNLMASVEVGYTNLIHQVVVVDSAKKKVSSSEAHQRVATSALFHSRAERAEARLKELMTALKAQNWSASYELMWAEFWDMQVLFETAKPTFGYISAESLHVLRWLQENTWKQTRDGPLITMDAGPNIHLLYRPEQRDLAEKVQREFTPMMNVLSSFDFESFHGSLGDL